MPAVGVVAIGQGGHGPSDDLEKVVKGFPLDHMLFVDRDDGKAHVSILPLESL